MDKLSKLFERSSLGSQILRYATIFDPASLVQLLKERLHERLQESRSCYCRTFSERSFAFSSVETKR